jgi:hypothetical protein
VKRLKVGDVVTYHTRIGGPPTSTGHTIKALDRLPSGHDVAWISGKSGCVAIEALSLAALDKESTP